MLTEATFSVSRDTGHAPDRVPPVLNGFLTWLNAMEDKKVGGLAGAFHLAMQQAGYVVPNFPHDSLRRQWERLWASLPLKPTVTQAVADFDKAHPLCLSVWAQPRAKRGTGKENQLVHA